MLELIQLLLLFSFIMITTIPVAFLVLGCNYLLTGRHAYSVLVAGMFVAGAVGGSLVAWQFVPSDWTLRFQTTLKATVDAEKYGHALEHYAEGVVVMISSAALFGGSVSAAVAVLCARRFRGPANTLR